MNDLVSMDKIPIGRIEYLDRRGEPIRSCFECTCYGEKEQKKDHRRVTCYCKTNQQPLPGGGRRTPKWCPGRQYKIEEVN